MKTIELTDDIRTEEPAAFLVFNYNTTISEYSVFQDEREANRFADEQMFQSDCPEWMIYPLYASYGRMRFA